MMSSNSQRYCGYFPGFEILSIRGNISKPDISTNVKQSIESVTFNIPEELFVWGHKAAHGFVFSTDFLPALIHLLSQIYLCGMNFKVFSFEDLFNLF